MDHIVLAVVVCLAQCASVEVRVWDGDTAWFGPEKVRLVGYDTPERGGRAHCPNEARMAEEARERLADLLRGASRIDLALKGGHSYDRRLGELAIDGRPVAEILITEGLATRRMAKPSKWCRKHRSG